MTMSIRLVIVDDHQLFREGVAQVLAHEPDLSVIGQGATAEDAPTLARTLSPDLMLLDIDLPGGGMDVIGPVRAASPATRIAMLTASTDEEQVLDALKAGAQGYILKGVSARELVAIIRAIHRGERYVPPALAAAMLTGVGGQNTIAKAPPDALTEREQQILDLVAQGASNKEIGQQLHLTEKTVKYYMTNILQKLGVRNRVEAAMLSRQSQRSRKV